MHFRANVPAVSIMVIALIGLNACAGGGGTMSTAPQTVPRAPDSAQTVGFTASSGTTWSVQAGASTLDQAFQALDFYWSSITIDEGDSVVWRIASEEPHTVSLLAPGQTPPSPDSPQSLMPAGGSTYDGTSFTNSGLLNDAQTYKLTFPKAGTYKYYCLLHEPAMEGTIVVQKAGTPYPHTQGYYLHQGYGDEWNDLRAAEAAPILFPFKPGGTTLAAGIAPGLAAGPPPQSTVLRFLNDTHAANRTISVPLGTTVTWVNESSNEPHTVSFPIAGHSIPPGPPNTPPAGGTTYDGSIYTSSGVMPPNGNYQLTFTKRGSYLYYCRFHSREGMYGRVNVI